MDNLIEIPARRGKAAFVMAGQIVTVINTHGEQVVDTWAFNRADLGEFMSNEHTRAHSLHLVPKPGDVLRTNKRRPILTFMEDTSGGVHDTLIAACDRYRYAFLGVEGHHDNCTDNLFAGMAELGLVPPRGAEPAQPVHEYSLGQGGHARSLPRRRGRSRAVMSACARRWTSSSPSRPARKTSCRSTARRESRSRRISRLPDSISEQINHGPDRTADCREPAPLRGASCGRAGVDAEGPAGANRARRRADCA